MRGPRLTALQQGRAAKASALGQQAIALLDRHRRSVPFDLLRVVADAALISGDGNTGRALLERAVERFDTGGQGVGTLERTRVLADYGRSLVTRDPDRAEQVLRQAQQLFATAGSEREATLCWGVIADINQQRGNLDEALRIRHELQLPVFERLGDVRAIAVTWGKIADIVERQGDWKTATDLLRQALDVFERLGDLAGTARAHFSLAQIEFSTENVASAIRRLVTSFQIYASLRHAEESPSSAWLLVASCSPAVWTMRRAMSSE